MIQRFPQVQKSAQPFGWAIFVRGDGESEQFHFRRELNGGDMFSSLPRKKTVEPCPAALMNVVNL